MVIACTSVTLISVPWISEISSSSPQSSSPTTSSFARSRPAPRGGCSSSSSRAPPGRCSFGCRSPRPTRTRRTARRLTTISTTRRPRALAEAAPDRAAAGADPAPEDQVSRRYFYPFRLGVQGCSSCHGKCFVKWYQRVPLAWLGSTAAAEHSNSLWNSRKTFNKNFPMT